MKMNMASFLVSLLTIFLVISLLLPTIKIISSSVTDAKQEQHIPHNHVLRTTDDRATSLLSGGRALSTDKTTVDSSLSSTTIVTPQYVIFDGGGVGDKCPGDTAIPQSECFSAASSVATQLDLDFDENFFRVGGYEAPCGCFLYYESSVDTYFIVYNSNSEECVVAQDTAIERLICWREDLPSSAPSSTPSSEPSLSSIPSSLTPKPSTRPLLSGKPPSKPISPIQDIDFIARDKYNRRYFPETPIRPEGSFPYQPVPDCSLSIGRVGCIAIPSPFEVAPPPWIGTLHATPPSCDKIKRECMIGIPIPRATHELGSALIPLNNGVFNEGTLPNSALRTESVAIGDVNNDGLLDIIIGNSGNDIIFQNNQLLINAGDGNFNNAVDLPGGAMNTRSIAVGDVNNDGMLDIIIGNKNQSNQLLMNTGDGAFNDAVDLPGGTLDTTSVAIGDMNNDGLLDIIIGNENQSNQLLINAGDGTFHNSVDLPGGSLDTKSVAIGDMNNDGILDIVIGNYSNTNQLLINNSDGTFNNAVDLPGGAAWTSSVAIADMNNDGMLDIVIGNIYHTNHLIFNTGDGTFSNDAVDLDHDAFHITMSVTIADMNNDGILDIIIGNHDQNNQLLINAGDGKFNDDAMDLPSNVAMKTKFLATADLNNDGMVDIIVGNIDENNQLLINANSDGAFDNVVDLPGGELWTSSVAIADMNNDGMLDIVIGNFYQRNQLLINADDDTFDDIVDLPGGDFVTNSVAIGDMNNDGVLDIVIGNAHEKNKLLINNGDGTFDNVVNLPGGSLDTKSLQIADMNNDGFLDIIIGNLGHDSIHQNNQLLINSGDGTFDNTVGLPGGSMNTTSVAIADVNNDGFLDIIIGNSGNDTIFQNNQLLINAGDGNFNNAVDLPGGAMNTRSIAVGDVNNDGMLDIIIGNFYGINQLLMNTGDGAFNDAVDLPGGTLNTTSVAIGDMNNDGLLDIIIGNVKQINQLIINAGDGNFNDIVDLSGGTLETYFVTVADMNNDGILDIFIGNSSHKNQLLPYSSCSDGGSVRLHSKSWCFRCPSFMGKVNSICRECAPDYMQQPGTSDYQCGLSSDEKCPLGQRKLGEDICSKRCPNGTYYDSNLTRLTNDPSTWIDPRCVQCVPGTYSKNDELPALDKCFECRPGTYQNESGKNRCLNCSVGQYQPKFGKTECNMCAKGGYCDASDKLSGGFIPCSPGTYNDKMSKSNKNACQLCPSGTYSTTSGGTSIDVCEECPPGTYSEQPGQTKCQPCRPGTFQGLSSQTSCDVCPSGTYADKSGFEECIKCPYRLSSKNGSILCPFCADDFYLNDLSASGQSIFQNPSTYCLDCPPNAICETNTTLYDLGVPKNYWRYSRNTAKLYPCKHSSSCVGTTNILEKEIKKNSIHDETGMYCSEGHKGPLCEVCTNKDHYFSTTNRECTKCPLLALLVLQFLVIIFGTIVVIALVYYLLRRHILTIYSILVSLSPQAKVKLLVSFYQVLSSLDKVYGVTVSSELTKWMDIFNFFTLDFLQITGMQMSCIARSTKQQLMIDALWPFMLIVLGGYYFLAYWMVQKRKMRNQVLDDGEVVRAQQVDTSSLVIFLKKRAIEWTIIVLYFALPVVSQSVCDAIKCRAFQINDNIPSPASQSHLLMDMSIICNTQKDNNYRSILATFWSLFTIWILLIPLAFVLLLKYIGPSVQSKSISFLAAACRFLWQDYDASIWFWDIVDTYRKIFLTGVIMLIDRNQGSNKMLRLVVAIIVSVLYFAFLLAYRPYKRNDDYYLAFLSNFLLITCFSLGIILKLCNGDEDNDGYDFVGGDDDTGTCHKFIGLSLDSYKASVLVVVLSVGMLLLTVCFLVIFAINKITAPTVRMKSSEQAPNLELPEDCNFHVFMSHVWGTGQAKTHAITRKMQLFLPGLKVWLDVDELQDISKLEESVAETAVFVLYYSKGYFRSTNCRREIYAAINLEKPIILLYEGDESVIEEMKDECIDNCGGDDGEHDCPGATVILEKLLGNTITRNDPKDDSFSMRHGLIQWLNEGSFSAAANNQIYSHILRHLPYYKRYPNLLLEEGIRVPGELGPVSLESPINLLICRKNYGCWDVAKELKTMLEETKESALLDIYDARVVFKNMQESGSFSDCHDSTNNSQSEFLDDLSMHDQNLFGDKPTFLLLYLNKNTFEGRAQDQHELTAIIQSCIDNKDIGIILVHEKDRLKGGCEFGDFFATAPEELIKPPYHLFRDIAIPLYSTEEYRIVSLRQILCKMGATVMTNSQGGTNMSAIVNPMIKKLMGTIAVS